MPQGIILSSSSAGATQEAIEKVFKDNGLEVEKPDTPPAEEAAEPQREDFKTDEEFEAAQEEFTAKQEEAEQQREEEEAERQRRQEEKHPKLTRRQRAIDKATRDLRRKVEQLEEQLAKGGKIQAEPEVKVPEAPKREQFKTDAEFDEAMFDYRYKLRRAKEESENARTAEQNRIQDNFQTYKDAVADFKEEHDDWDDVVNQSLELSQGVYFSILELRDDGPLVTYHLGKHPEELARLNRLSHHSAAMEVGRLLDRLKTGARPQREAGTGANQKPKQRLPEPVKPVSTAATASTLTSKDAAAQRDYRAFKAAQRRGA